MTFRPYTTDGAYFLGLTPFSGLWTAKRATRTLARETERLRALYDTLAMFPAYQRDGLDFWYATLRGLGALGPLLLEDLLERHGWRGIVWGGWLAMLRSDPELLPALERVPPTPHHNEWAAKLARDTLHGISRGTPEAVELRALARELRSILNDLPIPTMPLRVVATLAHHETLEAERERVRTAYHQGGREAARTALANTTLLANHLLPYPAWYRHQRGRPPRNAYLEDWRR